MAPRPSAIPPSWLRQRRKRRRIHSSCGVSSFFCCLTFRVGSILALLATIVYAVVEWYRETYHYHGSLLQLVNLHATVHQEWRTTAKNAAASRTATAWFDLPRYSYNIFEKTQHRQPKEDEDAEASSHHHETDTSNSLFQHTLEQATDRLLEDFIATYTVSDEDNALEDPSRRQHAHEILANRLSGSPSLRLGQRLGQRLLLVGAASPASEAHVLTVWIAGSSAAAGYGNVHTEHAYSRQFERLLRPFLESFSSLATTTTSGALVSLAMGLTLVMSMADL